MTTKGWFGLRVSSPRIPAHNRQGLALAAYMPGSLVGGCSLVGYSQLTYTCAYTCTCIHIYLHTHIVIYIYTNAPKYIHIYRLSGYPPPADAPHRSRQLRAQTLRLRNRKRSLKLRIFQQPGRQYQVVGPGHVGLLLTSMDTHRQIHFQILIYITREDITDEIKTISRDSSRSPDEFTALLLKQYYISKSLQPTFSNY